MSIKTWDRLFETDDKYSVIHIHEISAIPSHGGSDVHIGRIHALGRIVGASEGLVKSWEDAVCLIVRRNGLPVDLAGKPILSQSLLGAEGIGMKEEAAIIRCHHRKKTENDPPELALLRAADELN